MYSIIQVCKHGIKVRYVSDNLDSINEKYTVLNNLDNVDKLYIYDNLNNKYVELEEKDSCCKYISSIFTNL